MEALYGYMTESELDWCIMEKEYDIEMKRCIATFEASSSDSSFKARLGKLIKTISDFIGSIIDKIGELFGKKEQEELKNVDKNQKIRVNEDFGRHFKDLQARMKTVDKEIKTGKFTQKPEKDDTTSKYIKKGGIIVGVGTLLILLPAMLKWYADTKKSLDFIDNKIWHDDKKSIEKYSKLQDWTNNRFRGDNDTEEFKREREKIAKELIDEQIANREKIYSAYQEKYKILKESSSLTKRVSLTLKSAIMEAKKKASIKEVMK